MKVGKYEVHETLGDGAFGKVKRAVNSETGESVAIKFLDKEKIKQQNMSKQIQREIKQKEQAIEYLARRYRSRELPEEELKQCLNPTVRPLIALKWIQFGVTACVQRQYLEDSTQHMLIKEWNDQKRAERRRQVVHVVRREEDEPALDALRERIGGGQTEREDQRGGHGGSAVPGNAVQHQRTPMTRDINGGRRDDRDPG